MRRDTNSTYKVIQNTTTTVMIFWEFRGFYFQPVIDITLHIQKKIHLQCYQKKSNLSYKLCSLCSSTGRSHFGTLIANKVGHVEQCVSTFFLKNIQRFSMSNFCQGQIKARKGQKGDICRRPLLLRHLTSIFLFFSGIF